MRTAVVFTVSRNTYLRETLESWAKAFFNSVKYVDFRFHVEPVDDREEIFNTLEDFNNLIGAPLYVSLNKERKGVLLNPYEAFSSAFAEGYEYVILAEDDTVVANTYLDYHAWASEVFKHDPGVATVCGYRKIGEPYYSTAFFAPTFSPIGWGTWQDRWRNWIGPTWDKDYSTNNGTPGQESGWDWNLNAREMPRRQKVSIFPSMSQTSHIGRNGTHFTEDMWQQGIGIARDFHPDQAREPYWTLVRPPDEMYTDGGEIRFR